VRRQRTAAKTAAITVAAAIVQGRDIY
jgi:hypothetical protein